jgi:hypothetical protein
MAQEVFVMTELVLELSPELYERLEAQAKQLKKSTQVVAQEWLAERLNESLSVLLDEQAQATEALRAAGLWAELSLEEKKQAAQNTATLDEVRATLDRAGGQPLSELIVAMRGPKE